MSERGRRRARQRSKGRPGERLAVLLFALLASGCDAVVGPESMQIGPAIERPDVRPFVTESVAAGLDGRGRFVYPAGPPSGDDRTISLANAVELAEGFVRVFIANEETLSIPGTVGIREVLETRHGLPIDWQALVVEPDGVFLADTYLFEPWNHVEGLSALNHTGPRYVVPLLDDGVQVGSLSIAAFAAETRFTSEGLLITPAGGGNEFRWQGHSYLADYTVPVTPEVAVRRVATAFDVSADSRPYLLRPRVTLASFWSKWEVRLEESVLVRRLRDGALIRTERIFVGAEAGDPVLPEEERGRRIRFYVPAAEQPVKDEVRANGTRLFVPIREGVPVAFREVVPSE